MLRAYLATTHSGVKHRVKIPDPGKNTRIKTMTYDLTVNIGCGGMRSGTAAETQCRNLAIHSFGELQMPESENIHDDDSVQSDFDVLAISDDTAAVIYIYSDGDMERVELQNVARIHVDDGSRHYITLHDGRGRILPPPDEIEIVPKAGRSAFAI
jgi:hypothetical protein